ncbi:MAG: branched-chain amino acid ABC transporter permease [Desulfobacterota bacterium]|nr:branched-chain amino acid ABC transporter permease [Thermodesulfobacteriota bacterium]
MDLLLHLWIMIFIYSIFAMSLNLQMGYTGLFNFGHIAFFGIGAYTSALLTLHHFPFALAFWVALAASGLCGFLLSIPSLRLRGDYFGIATLGFGEIIRMVSQNEVWLTKGPMGLPGIPKPVLFSYRFGTLPQYLLLTFGLTLLTFLILRRVIRSPLGRTFRGIREDEIALMALGKNTFHFKIKSVLIGSVFAGLAGVLWAHYTTFISPGDFTLSETILVLLIVVLGGKGTEWGPLVGAFVLIFFQESLRFLKLPAEWGRYLAPLQQMIFGALLIFLMVYRPEGLIREKGGGR